MLEILFGADGTAIFEALDANDFGRLIYVLFSKIQTQSFEESKAALRKIWSALADKNPAWAAGQQQQDPTEFLSVYLEDTELRRGINAAWTHYQQATVRSHDAKVE